MNNQKKVKFIISLAVIAVVVLTGVVLFQLVNIHKLNMTILKQQDQIEQNQKKR
jgi:cytochrome b subunit of formate dehydrogenase